MKSELIMAVNQICAEKDLPPEVILGAIEDALVHAYRRNCSNSAVGVKVKIDPASGDLRIFCEKRVVQKVRDPDAEIDLESARRLDPKAELGGTVLVERDPVDFGRIAAQTAKQVILQRIHEAERDVLYEYFRQREGELVTGTVQAIDFRTEQVTVSLGKKAEGILAKEDQLPNDRYRIGLTVRSLLAEVTKGTRGPQIRLSRTHRNMLRRLLEREVPEIYNGTVEIKAIAREPGQRSKVAVAATQPGVDPVGSCVGMRGTRIQNIVDELNGEKIDVVEWSSDPRRFISNALSPAKPTETLLIEDGDIRTAVVVVPDRQLSLAIGKEGQNARLAAKLTGWRIDIKSETEAATEGLAELRRQQMQLIKARSLEAKAAGAAPADDLLTRAEWLLREKDRSAVTMEQAAKMLASMEAASEEQTGEPATPALPLSAEPTEPAAPAAADATAEPPEAIYEEEEFIEYFGAEEEEEEDETTKRGKRKKAGQKRQLVYDDRLGAVVSRKRRKPSRRTWDEDLEEY
jgi:N utilization substance protein A